MQETEIELFFNAGDIEKQANWLIYPQSLTNLEMEEIFNITANQHEKSFSMEVKKYYEVEEELNRKKTYPDPTKLKNFSKWYYAQIKKGAILYRFGYDGRRETDTKRINSSIEGAFIPSIDIDRTIKKYKRVGIDIVDEIGSQIPGNMEKFLVGQNFDIFKKLYRQYESEGKLDCLYNHFYVACWGNEITVQKKYRQDHFVKLVHLVKYLSRKKEVEYEKRI